LGKYSRSVSQLKSVTRCGEAFRLERLSFPKTPRRPAAWTVLGIALHEVFPEWEIGDRKDDPVQMFDVAFDKILAEEQQRQPDQEMWQKAPNAKTVDNDIKNYKKRGMTKDVPLYQQRCVEAEWEILHLPDGDRALELEFELELGEVTVKGALDRVLWFPGKKMAAMEDLKSGSPDDEVDTRQLGLYSLAAAECYGLDISHGRYWYTKLDRPGDWVDLSRYSRDYLTQEYGRLDELIDRNLLLPNPGKHCGLCGSRPWCSELGWLKPGEGLFGPNEETATATN